MGNWEMFDSAQGNARKLKERSREISQKTRQARKDVEAYHNFDSVHPRTASQSRAAAAAYVPLGPYVMREPAGHVDVDTTAMSPLKSKERRLILVLLIGRGHMREKRFTS